MKKKEMEKETKNYRNLYKQPSNVIASIPTPLSSPRRIQKIPSPPRSPPISKKKISPKPPPRSSPIIRKNIKTKQSTYNNKKILQALVLSSILGLSNIHPNTDLNNYTQYNGLNNTDHTSYISTGNGLNDVLHNYNFIEPTDYKSNLIQNVPIYTTDSYNYIGTLYDGIENEDFFHTVPAIQEYLSKNYDYIPITPDDIKFINTQYLKNIYSSSLYGLYYTGQVNDSIKSIFKNLRYLQYMRIQAQKKEEIEKAKELKKIQDKKIKDDIQDEKRAERRKRYIEERYKKNPNFDENAFWKRLLEEEKD